MACPVETSQARCFSDSASGAISAFVEQGCSAMNEAIFANSGIAWAVSNTFGSEPVTNSGPRASLARKKCIFR